MPAEGGEATNWSTRKKSIESFAWSPDGAQIAFLAPDDPTDEDERREKERDDADVYGERWSYNRLHLLDLATGAVTTLPTGDTHVFECAWSLDGATIAYLARPTPELDENQRAALFTIATAGGEPRRLCDAIGGSTPRLGRVGSNRRHACLCRAARAGATMLIHHLGRLGGWG